MASCMRSHRAREVVIKVQIMRTGNVPVRVRALALAGIGQRKPYIEHDSLLIAQNVLEVSRTDDGGELHIASKQRMNNTQKERSGSRPGSRMAVLGQLRIMEI